MTLGITHRYLITCYAFSFLTDGPPSLDLHLLTPLTLAKGSILALCLHRIVLTVTLCSLSSNESQPQRLHIIE